jgi:cytochrome c-type biogenesis protein CcsB
MHIMLFHSILFAYLFASVVFWLMLGWRQRWLLRLAHVLLGVGIGLQTLHLGARLSAHPSQLWGDVYVSMGLLSWAIVVVYFIAWWWYRIDVLGAFIIPFSFLAAASAGVSGTTAEVLPTAFQHFWLIVHVFLAILGYAALTLAFCTGLMYLIQEKQLKSKHAGTLYNRLPSLNLLDELNARALFLGFPLLTQGIITGSVWAKYVSGSYLHWSPRSLPLLLAWMIYALLLGGRYALGWQGKKAACAAIAGFLVVLASYFVHTL